MDIHFGVCDAANDPTDKQTEPTDCFFIPQTDLQLSKQKPETVSHTLSVLLDYRRVTVSFITDMQTDAWYKKQPNTSNNMR